MNIRICDKTPASQTLLYTWIIVVIVKQHLVQVGRMDGPTECLSQVLAAIRSGLLLQVWVLLTEPVSKAMSEGVRFERDLYDVYARPAARPTTM